MPLVPLRTAAVQRQQAPASERPIDAGDDSDAATGGQYIPFYGNDLQNPKNRDGVASGSLRATVRRCLCFAFIAGVVILALLLGLRDRSTGHATLARTFGLHALWAAADGGGGAPAAAAAPPCPDWVCPGNKYCEGADKCPFHKVLEKMERVGAIMDQRIAFLDEVLA